MATFVPTYGYYDVTAYGAIGNGNADDAPAIQAAELACEQNMIPGEPNGGIVYFPPGTYLVKSTTVIGQTRLSQVSWQGAGAGASIITLSTSAGSDPLNTPIVQVLPGCNNVRFSDLSFHGNNLNSDGNPPEPNSNALAIGATTSQTTFCSITNCKFYQTTAGPTISFYAVTDAEVSGCHFFQIGHDNGSPGASRTTPGVFVDPNCINIRIQNNHFEQCFFDGVQVMGHQCEVSSNYFTGCKASSIETGIHNGDGSGLRAFGNYVDLTAEVGANNQGVYIQAITDFQVVGNTVTRSDNDGIAGGGCANGAYVGNITFDNGQNRGTGGGLTGFQYIDQSVSRPVKNQSITFVGNVSYDDQTSPNKTQEIGLRMFSDGAAPAQGFSLLGNTFWGNDSTAIELGSDANENIIFNDNSDVTVGNVHWIDREHATSKTLTGTMSKSALAATNPTVNTFSMLSMNGIRIVASGKTTNGATPHGTRTFYLGFGASGNLMNAVNAGTSNASWQLEAYVVNNADVGGGGYGKSQCGFVHFWYDGALIYHEPVATSIDTTAQVTVLFEGVLGHSSDSIITHFLEVERI